MNAKLLFFAQTAGWVHRQKMEIDFSEPKALIHLIQETPELAPILENRKMLKISINQEFVSFETEVKDGDEIAFLPPLSGG